MQIHITRNGQQHGPYNEEQLTDKLASGEISYDDLGWVDGMAEWLPLRQIVIPPGGTPPPPPIRPGSTGVAPSVVEQINSEASKDVDLKTLIKSLGFLIVIGFIIWNTFFSTPKSTSTDTKKIGNTIKEVSKPVGAEKIYSQSGDAAIEEARKFMVGTWTSAKTTQFFTWTKWVINADGTILDYTAAASADDWGTPKKYEWEIITDKYINTGKRFYAFHVKDWATKSIILNDGSVVQNLPDEKIKMERGDRNPFSK